MKYRLIMNGNCFEGSAHILSDNEVKKIREYQNKNGIDTLTEMHSELTDILGTENYIPDQHTNYWINATSFKDSRLNFVLTDENDKLIWRSKEIRHIEETPWIDEVSNEDLNAPELLAYKGPGNAELDAYPYQAKSNILLYYQELRGTLVSYKVESEREPKPSDFALTTRSLETPYYEIELVDKVFHKGKYLERLYDHEEYRAKNLTIELFTLEDV